MQVDSIAAGRLKATRIVRINSFASVSGADIEDMFDPSEHLDLYNNTFSKSLTLAALTGSDRIVKRIERQECEPDHGAVAAHSLRNLAASLAVLSEATLARFEALVVALAAALPPPA